MERVNEVSSSLERVNIIIGRFQPMTKGHLKCIEAAYKNGLRTVICIINTQKTDPKKPFKTRELLPIYKRFARSRQDIADIRIIKSANIIDIGMELGQDYIIQSLVCGQDREKDYRRITTDYKEQAGLPDDFELVVLPRTDEDISATQCREAIKNGDFETFKRLYIPFEPEMSYELFKNLI